MLLALLLSAILAGQLALLGGCLYVYSKARQTIRSIKEETASFFEIHGQGDDQTSGFTEVIAGIGDIFAQKIGISTQAALRGSIGGSMKSLNKELEQQAIAENPSLAMAEFLPKSLKKNPLALMGLNSIMQRYAGQLLQGGGPGPGSQAAKDNGQAQFNL